MTSLSLLLWIAGVQYLLVRARTSRIIGGFDLHSDAGWQELKDSVHISAQQLFAAAPVRRRRAPPRSAQGRRSP